MAEVSLTPQEREKAEHSIQDLRNIQEEVDTIRSGKDKARRQWRLVYYTVGLASVAAAGMAGVSGLADFLSVQVVGAIAVASAVLGAVDKWLTADKKIETLSEQITAADAVRFKIHDNSNTELSEYESYEEFDKWADRKLRQARQLRDKLVANQPIKPSA